MIEAVAPDRSGLSDNQELAAEVLYTQAEFIKVLKTSETTFYNLLAKGAIGPLPVIVGGRKRWLRDEIQLWFVNRRFNGALHGRKTWPAILAGLKGMQQPLQVG